MNKKTLNIQQYELPINIKKEEDGGFTASCSVWRDCYAQGETIEEAISEISLVAASLIELYNEEELIIPLKLKNKENNNREFNMNFPLVISVN